MKRKLLLMLGALVGFASCYINDVDDSTPSIVSEITFETGDIKSRVSGSQFESGDVVLVEAYTTAGNLHATASYSYDGSGSFTTNSPISQNGESKLSFAAVYPSNTTANSFDTDFDFAISTDQSSEDRYESSDMLVAKVEETDLTKPTLTFYHTMTVIDVKIDGATSLDNCTVVISAMNNATVNITDGSYEGTGSATAITPLMTSDGFCVIVAPQTLAAGEFATMTIGGNSYTWSLSVSSTLLSGYRYSYTWTVDEVTGDSDVAFEGLISDWAEGDWNSDSTEGGSTEGGSTGDGSTEEEDDTTTGVETILISIDGTEYTQGAYVDGEEFDADGYTMTGILIANYTSLYDSTGPIQFKASGSYIYNNTAIEGLTKIAITASSTYNNFTVYAGSSENPTSTTVINANEGTSGSAGDIYTYTIPSGSTYFTIANDSSYASYADQIDIYTTK